VRELCGKAGVNSVTLCRPLPYGLHAAPLERGWRNPRKRYGHLPRARAGQRRDIRLAERISSITSGPVQPSPSLCYHPCHCSSIPDTMGAQDNKTSPRSLLCVLRPPVSCTLESAYGRRPNGEFPRTPTGARFVRTTIKSMTLCAMPPYVALRIVRHDCKPPPLGL
jgi:hypothetical protein